MKQLASLLALLLATSSLAQEFRNLDFESPELPAQLNPFENPFSKLFPGWHGTIQGSSAEASLAWYDSVWDVKGFGLSDASVESEMAWGNPVVLSGRFSALLVTFSNNSTSQLGLYQTGVVPEDAKSLRFRTASFPIIGDPWLRSDQWGVTASLNGQRLNTHLSEITSSQAVWSADVSDFAGQSACLAFDLWLDARGKPHSNWGQYTGAALDDIAFSPEPTRGLPGITNSTVVRWGERLDTVPMPPGASNLVLLSAGFLHTAGLRADGQVFAWGDGMESCTLVPASISNVVSVAGAYGKTYALTEEGSILCWPSTNIVQPGLTNAVAISANATCALVLKADGTVAALGTWNRDFWGSLPEVAPAAYVPAGMTNITAIAAGGLHSVALRSDGRVIAWEKFSYMDPLISKTNVPPDATNIIAIAAGGLHSLAVKADGTVIAWGDNRYNQTNVPPGLSNVVAVAAGSYHSLALRANGTVVAWGDNEKGQTNVPAGLTNVIAISARGNQSLALLSTHPPVTATAIDQYSLSNQEFAVSIPTEPGRVYRLEYTDGLDTGVWRPLPLISGNGGSRVLRDTNTTGAARFYRVGRW